MSHPDHDHGCKCDAVHVHIYPDPLIAQLLTFILERQTDMATQADVDALSAQLFDATTSIQTEVGELGAATALILQEIADLQNANPALDLTGLNAAVDGVVSVSTAIVDAANTVEAIPPAPVEPPVESV